MFRLRLLLAVGLYAACDPEHGPDRARAEAASQVAPASSGREPSRASGASGGTPEAIERERACLDRIGRVVTTEPLPGDPAFDAQRAQLLVRGKGNPGLFVRRPRPSGSARAREIRTTIERAPIPARALYDAYPTLAREPPLAREVLLREGYLYTELPALASALSSAVRLNHLFQDDEVWIHRGDVVLRAVRRRIAGRWTYEYADGPDRGEPAQILFLDRVAASPAELETPLHRALLPLARQLGFDRAAVRHVTAGAMVAELRYGTTWVPSLLETTGASVRLGCEAVPPAEEPQVRAFRANAQRLERLLASQRAIIEQQIDEDLPFDEPKTEVGQQDGKLRQEWMWAYRFGRSHFEFNDDRYPVFDGRGRPRVPQVCIDFIRDTFERMSGSWYRPRGEPRARVRGRLSFRDHGIENERSVESFVAYAATHPESFQVLNLEEDERIRFIKRRDFYAFLFARRDDFRPGDVVTIYGLRDDDKMHYHSFFIYEADPITGMPTLVAANAGRPRIRAWDAEMVNAPLRSIKSRIRPTLTWLESITEFDGAAVALNDPAPPI